MLNKTGRFVNCILYFTHLRNSNSEPLHVWGSHKLRARITCQTVMVTRIMYLREYMPTTTPFTTITW